MGTDKREFDKAGKAVFSHAIIIEHLVKGFMKGSWVKELDFDSLEQLDKSFITDKSLSAFESDVVWRINWRDEPIYLLLLLELQSRNDPLMAVRLNNYVSMMYLSLAKRDPSVRAAEHLPPVLPIVLYQGTGDWCAATALSDLRHPALPKGLIPYQPSLKYWLLEMEKVHRGRNSANLIELLADLAHNPEDFDAATAAAQAIEALYSGPEHDVLRRSMVIYFKQVVSGVHNVQLQSTHLTEGDSMVHWITKIQQDKQNIDSLVSQGEARGVSRGGYEFAIRLLEKRFGKLTKKHRHVLYGMDDDELTLACSRAVLYESMDELLDNL